jgi:hypothetical protein
MSAHLSSADAAWLHMDRPTNLMVINSVLLFDGPVDFERIKGIYGRRLIGRYPRFASAWSRAACRCAPRAGRTTRTSISSTTCTIWRYRRRATHTAAAADQ